MSPLTFAPGRLGLEPVRIPIIDARGDWVAIDKPPGLSCFPVPWEPADSPNLLAEMRRIASDGRTGWREAGLDRLRRVHFLESVIGGILVLAIGPEAAARLRNTLGSGGMRFRFEFLSHAGPGKGPLDCDLPLGPPRGRGKAGVSHRYGRKTHTVFRRLEVLGPFGWWQAESVYDRPHQIRVHAAESGIPVTGDRLYGGGAPPRLSEFKRNFRGIERERPLYSGLVLQLVRIEWEEDSGKVCLQAPLPRRMEGLKKTLRRYTPRGGAMKKRGK